MRRQETDLEQSTTRRTLLAAHGITGIGDGLWFTVWAIYLTATQGISIASMGVGLGIGSAIGIALAAPLGGLADRWSPRELLAVLSVLRGVALLGFLWVSSIWPLVMASALLVATQSAAAGIRTTLIYKLIAPEFRLRVLAQSRVVQHITYAIGAALGGLVLTLDTRPVFVASIVGIASTLVVAAVITLTVPAVESIPAERRHHLTLAIRDLPFVSVMLATAPLALCWAMLAPGIALWVRSDTTAPPWTSAYVVVVSSALIALLQVRFTERMRRTIVAVRAARWSGLGLAAACLLFAASALPRNPALAFAVITLGVIAHAFGELQFVAARWGLSLRLMARDAEGQYQGLVAITEAAVSAIGPAIVAVLLAGAGGYGWIALACLVVLPVLPLGMLVRTALRTRPATSQHSASTT